MNPLISTPSKPHFNFIDIDENGLTSFRRYFAYLLSDKTQQSLPNHFKTFFNDFSRYDLNSATTLHDAWLIGFSLQNDFPGRQAETILTLELMQAFHQQKIILSYLGVSHYQISAMYDTYLAQPRDLLWHELTLLDGAFRHLIMFDEDFSIEVIFQDFKFSDIDL